MEGAAIDREAVARLAEKAITRVKIGELWAAGYRPSAKQSLRNAQFLHNELPIRFAHRVKQLQMLPFGLSEDPRIQEAATVYSRLIMLILRHPVPASPEHELTFAQLLREATPPFYSVPHHIGAALLDVATHSEAEQRELDYQLDNFFSARIGQRFLFQHYIASREERRLTFSGIIQSDCSPVAVCEAAASEAVNAVRAACGSSPQVELIGDRELTFTFVPSHIFFVVEELLKNACKATVDHHQPWGRELPPVRVIVAKGDQEVFIKVADEGGGIARSKLRDKWSYRGSKLCSGRHRDAVGLQRLGAAPPASPGLGLPMSRLYAKYFGGTLHLLPMEGFGTDTYVMFNRLGNANCEDPPPAVSNAPGGTESLDEALGEAASASLFDAQARRVEKIRVDNKKMPSQQPETPS